MALRRPAVDARAYLVRADRLPALSPRLRGVLRAALMAFAYVPFLLVLWVGLTVLVARGEVLPGVQVGAVPVGGMDVVDARAEVDRHYSAALGQPVHLVVDGQTWTPLPVELGFSIESDAAVDRAMAYGREHEVLDGVLRAARLPEAAVIVPVNVGLDAAAFNHYLDRIERELGGEPVNAAVLIDGDQVDIVAAEPGLGIDRAALRQAIAEKLAASEPVTIDTVRSPRDPSIPTGEATSAHAFVERVVADPIVLIAGDATWELEASTMLSLVEVVSDPTSPGELIVRVRPEAVESIVDEVAASIDREARDARIQDLGTHSRLVPSETGRTVDREALAASIHAAMSSDQRELTVPLVDLVEPKVTTDDVMQELGITDVVATGDSVYSGSGIGRKHNVELAAERIDGTLVEPGGVFSFNDAVGSLFSGEYRDGMSFIDGLIEPSLAGGVCQVTTTVFRAVLEAGFPVLEWHPHYYRSPYYELGGWSPGYDASITQFERGTEQSTDFTFRNPTDSWLMIRATVLDGDELTVEIFGEPTGYDVWFDEPVIETVEWATDEVAIAVDEELPPGTVLSDLPQMDGLEVTVVRYVVDEDGEVTVDTFVSTYGAYGAVRRVSPDMEHKAGDE